MARTAKSRWHVLHDYAEMCRKHNLSLLQQNLLLYLVIVAQGSARVELPPVIGLLLRFPRFSRSRISRTLDELKAAGLVGLHDPREYGPLHYSLDVPTLVPVGRTRGSCGEPPRESPARLCDYVSDRLFRLEEHLAKASAIIQTLVEAAEREPYTPISHIIDTLAPEARTYHERKEP